MTRLLALLTALLLALPVWADDEDDDKGKGRARGEEMRSERANCEQQANQRNLIGKERRRFVKDCAKGDPHGNRRDDRDHRRGDKPAGTQPAPTPAPTAQPAPTTAPAPAPTTQPVPQPATPPVASPAPAPVPTTDPAKPAPAPKPVAAKYPPGSVERQKQCNADPENKTRSQRMRCYTAP